MSKQDVLHTSRTENTDNTEIFNPKDLNTQLQEISFDDTDDKDYDS